MDVRKIEYEVLGGKEVQVNAPLVAETAAPKTSPSPPPAIRISEAATRPIEIQEPRAYPTAPSAIVASDMVGDADVVGASKSGEAVPPGALTPPRTSAPPAPPSASMLDTLKTSHGPLPLWGWIGCGVLSGFVGGALAARKWWR